MKNVVQGSTAKFTVLFVLLLALVILVPVLNARAYSGHVDRLIKLLAQRCVEREATYHATVLNLEEDRQNLRAQRALYVAQIQQIGHLVTLGASERQGLIDNYVVAVGVVDKNLAAKSNAIDATLAAPPRCEEFTR